jgi:hypothetical protein
MYQEMYQDRMASKPLEEWSKSTLKEALQSAKRVQGSMKRKGRRTPQALARYIKKLEYEILRKSGRDTAKCHTLTR